MAKKLNEKYGLFEDTVRLLAEHVPEAVEPEEIHINLGATWIPVKYIIAFVQYLLETHQKDALLQLLQDLYS